MGFIKINAHGYYIHMNYKAFPYGAIKTKIKQKKKKTETSVLSVIIIASMLIGKELTYQLLLEQHEPLSVQSSVVQPFGLLFSNDHERPRTHE